MPCAVKSTESLDLPPFASEGDEFEIERAKRSVGERMDSCRPGHDAGAEMLGADYNKGLIALPWLTSYTAGDCGAKHARRPPVFPRRWPPQSNVAGPTASSTNSTRRNRASTGIRAKSHQGAFFFRGV
jgi:hypothetical protein